MTDILFYVFAAMTLVCGFLVVANPLSRSPVTSAMFLVLTIISMSGLFLLLHAFFLAAIQVLVYAGAVMVLFLFVIMLLNLPEEERRRLKTFSLVTGLGSVGLLLFVILRTFTQSLLPRGVEPTLEGATVPLGKLLFTDYLLPFEIVSVLLLVAMVGAILLSKKEVN